MVTLDYLDFPVTYAVLRVLISGVAFLSQIFRLCWYRMTYSSISRWIHRFMKHPIPLISNLVSSFNITIYRWIYWKIISKSYFATSMEIITWFCKKNFYNEDISVMLEIIGYQAETTNFRFNTSDSLIQNNSNILLFRTIQMFRRYFILLCFMI